MADDVQIRFTADATSAIRSISSLKEAIEMLSPTLSEFSSSSIRVFRDQMQTLVDMKDMTTQQALGLDIQYTARLRDQEAQRLAWQRVDPIPRFARSLVAWGVAREESLAEVEAEAMSEMVEVRAAAEAAPVPGPDSVFEDLFAPGPGT